MLSAAILFGALMVKVLFHVNHDFHADYFHVFLAFTFKRLNFPYYYMKLYLFSLFVSDCPANV